MVLREKGCEMGELQQKFEISQQECMKLVKKYEDKQGGS